MNVDDIVAEKIAAARARVEATKRRRAALAAARQRGLAARHAQRLRNLNRGDTPTADGSEGDSPSPSKRHQGEMTMDLQALAADLIARTERAVEQIAGLAAHTGITFKTTDVVDAVERDLPSDYPAPTADGALTRRDVITAMAEDILSGAVYEDHA
ncbi:hypothetical protein ACWCP6_17940 [Streptomyces sp. NPDC002004]